MNILVLLGCLGLTFTVWGAHFQSKNEVRPAFLNFPTIARESSIHFDKAGEFWKFFKSNKDNIEVPTTVFSDADDPPKHYSAHHVLLQYYDENYRGWVHFCSATLLDECLVLTTTFCIILFAILSQDYRLNVVAGAYDLNRKDEKPRQSSLGAFLVQHPSFDPETWEYDFIIIGVEECFTINQHVKPKEIANSGPSGTCVYSGWNLAYSADSSHQNVLKNKTMEVMSRKECVDFYKKLDFDVPRTMFCAKSNNGNNDVWDFSGPLVCGNSVSGTAFIPETFDDKHYPGLFNDVSMAKSYWK